MTIVKALAAFISASFAGILQHFFNDVEYKKVEEVKSCCKKVNASTPNQYLWKIERSHQICLCRSFR